MSSRGGAFHAGLLACLMLAGQHGHGQEPAPEFVEELFKGHVPTGGSLVVSGEAARVSADLLGHTYPRREVQYWRDASRAVWVLDANGKHGLITAAFVVEDGEIRDSKVLSHREIRGKGIQSRRFLRQLRGARLDPRGRLTRRVEGVSGATISYGAVKNMARLALHLDAELPPVELLAE
jgi:hypothetical protein